MRAAAALALALALAGCAGGAPVPGGADAVPGRVLPPVPTERGVDVPGTGREIGFGRHLPGAEAALARLYGPPARRPCAGGTILSVGALDLHFRGETFAGWESGDARAGRLCTT